METTALARRFDAYHRLTVRQRRKWLEVLLSFEFKNAYDVYDHREQAVLNARETGEGAGEFFRRAFLGPNRPFEMEVSDLASGQVVLRLSRPWRWFFHRLEVHDGEGRYLGAVQKQWSWLRRLYTIEGPNGEALAELFGPILKPWTFEIREQGHALGVIRKKWSGLGREMLSDADNFGVELEQLSPALRPLAFAATVLVDVVHFERAKNG